MIYERAETQGDNIKLLMIGRSGGGWTTALYSAIDPRIQVAVPVTGLKPLSMRLAEPFLRDLGDYEQLAPDIYDVVPYEDIMKTAGCVGSLFIYNTFDPCCFSVNTNSELVQYLHDASLRYHKRIDIWIDENNLEHSISEQGYEILDDFLKSINFWKSGVMGSRGLAL